MVAYGLQVLGIPPYLDQLPATAAGLQGAAGITLAQTGIANSANARFDIPVIGDSVTEGQGATTVGGRWVEQANRAVRLAYPTGSDTVAGSLGFIPLQTTGESSFTWPVALASGSAGFTAPIGPVRQAPTLGAAGSFTWTAPAGTTSCKIMYYDVGDGSIFSWKVNAGAPTNVTQNTGSGDGALTASIPISAGQVLTIAWVSGASAFPEGIIPFSGDETSGVTFHACGHFGWQAGTAADFNGWNQTGYNVPWHKSLGALIPGAGAIAIMLGINDSFYYSGAAFQANLQALVTFLQGGLGYTGLAALPILLIIPYQPAQVFQAGSWTPYVAAIRAVAAATANTHVIDLNYRMPSVASGFDGFALYADNYHPTNLGHALLGSIAAAGIAIA